MLTDYLINFPPFFIFGLMNATILYPSSNLSDNNNDVSTEDRKIYSYPGAKVYIMSQIFCVVEKLRKENINQFTKLTDYIINY